MMVKYLIFLLGWLFLIKRNSTHPTCAQTYSISVASDYLKAAFHVSVPTKRLGAGIELELIFVFSYLPIVDDDMPRFEITDKQFRFGTNTDVDDDNFLDLSSTVYFGSGRKFPRIGRISIRYTNETVVVCENVEEYNSGTVLVRVIKNYRSDAISNYINSEFENPKELGCEILERFPFYYCTINTTLTKDHTNVVIRGYSTDLLILELLGEIHRLQSVFCQKFPDLIVMEANRLSLEHIDENAFYKCTKLRKLNLRRNKLTYIPAKTFEKSNKLQVLNLQYNKIQSFVWSDSLKHLPNLQILNLEITQLSQFNIDEIEIMKKMRYLEIRGIDQGVLDNNLTTNRNFVVQSLDEKKFHVKFPNLQKLVLADANTDDTVDSTTLNRIKEFFIKYGVTCCTSNSHVNGDI